MSRPEVLPTGFFQRSASEVARDLLGAVIVSRMGGTLVSGHIVETEAYLGVDDPASHAWRGRRHAGNEGIYSPPGFWYVYRSYGIHWCANLVTAPEGHGAAVLLRAVAPLSGHDTMRARRRLRHGMPDATLADGPGKLAQALGIDRSLDRLSMTGSPVIVARGVRMTDTWVVAAPRVGITRAAEWALRYTVMAGGPWRTGNCREAVGPGRTPVRRSH